jgi:hypothetical protein
VNPGTCAHGPPRNNSLKQGVVVAGQMRKAGSGVVDDKVQVAGGQKMAGSEGGGWGCWGCLRKGMRSLVYLYNQHTDSTYL